MNKKRNVSYIKPEDPEFLKVLKRQAGYDDKNHKFDELQEDFVSDDDSEKPQVVVLKQGDLNAEEAEAEQKKIEKLESEKKADLNERVIFKTKAKSSELPETVPSKKKKSTTSKDKTKSQLLSFNNEEEEELCET